jgi:hypothetical protein
MFTMGTRMKGKLWMDLNPMLKWPVTPTPTPTP